MSLHTIRITVNNVAALNGTTELPVGSAVVSSLADGNIYEASTDEAFGLFDPGQFINQRNQSFIITNITVISEGAAAHPAGSLVNMISPDRAGGGVGNSRQLIALQTAAGGTGIIPTSNIAVPTDHKMAFVGPSAGPHVIQISMVPVPENYIEHLAAVPDVDTSIYNGDGTLSGNRTVTMGSNTLSFVGNTVIAPSTRLLQDTPAIGEVPIASDALGNWAWGAVAIPCSNTQVVNTLADLPAAVSDERVLLANVTYEICDAIVLPDDEFLTMNDGTVLSGHNSIVSTITGSVAGAELIRSAAGASVEILNVGVVNSGGAGASCLNLAGTSGGAPTERLRIYKCAFSDDEVGPIEDFADVVFSYNTVTNSRGGVAFGGSVLRLLFEENTFSGAPGSSSQDVEFLAGFINNIATFRNNTMLNATYTGEGPGGGTFRALDAQLPAAPGMTFRENYFVSAKPFSGISSQSLGKWMVNNQGNATANVVLVDSARRGGISIAGNTAQNTVITTINTFVRVGQGNASHPLFAGDVGNERFSVQGASAVTQTLRHDGLQQFRGFISLFAKFECPIDAQLEMDIEIWRLPDGGSESLIPLSTVRVQMPNGTAGMTVGTSWEVPITFAPLEEFFVKVANATNTDDFRVVEIRLDGRGGTR